ncbi:MAG: NAD-dependent DNA ligase LigA [Verrucomicrobiaceae bacterium]|nr:NAD-dependent DNA ligase LigA [Verrucomicrobiaceae bacterium]
MTLDSSEQNDVGHRIDWLRQEISRHNDLYYQKADPEITDYEYDLLVAELSRLELENPSLKSSDSPSQSVGNDQIAGFVQVKHGSPMLSLENGYNESDIEKFYIRCRKDLSSSQLRFTVEPKVDGVAIALRYSKGKLVYAATRGDGEFGDDVTDNVLTIKGLPKSLPTSVANDFEVRGEVFMSKSTFQLVNEERELASEPRFANPRNAAAGTLKMLNSEVVATRPLEIVCYSIVEDGGLPIATQKDVFDTLKNLKFPYPEEVTYANMLNELIEATEKINQRRDSFPYEIDGAVIKVDDLSQRAILGTNTKSPRWALAYKYPPKRAATKLISIEVQVGRTGVLTPVAHLSPVLLSGSTVTYATLHNFNEIERRDIRIGDKVIIQKCGDIIPAIVDVIYSERIGNPSEIPRFERPSKCPVCHAPAVQTDGEVALRCSNQECPGRIVRQLQFLASRPALDISDVGGTTAEILVNSGIIKHPLDIFSLTADRIANLDLGQGAGRRKLGTKTAEKIIRGIEAARKKPLYRWIVALGIKGIGVTGARCLAKNFTGFREMRDSPVLQAIVKESELASARLAKSPQTLANRHKTVADKLQLEEQELELRKELWNHQSEMVKFGWARFVGGSNPDPHKVNRVKVPVPDVVARGILCFFSGDDGLALINRLDEILPSPSASDTSSSEGGKLSGKSFVLTGTLETMDRDEAADLLRSLGADIASSVSSKTDFLIVGSKPGANKVKAATDRNIPIMSEEDLLALVGRNDDDYSESPQMLAARVDDLNLQQMELL